MRKNTGGNENESYVKNSYYVTKRGDAPFQKEKFYMFKQPDRFSKSCYQSQAKIV